MLSPAVPTVSLTPSNLSFGNQLVGTTSAPQTITLANTGSSTLTVFGVGFSAYSSGDFSETFTCANASFIAGLIATIAPNGSCSISVLFRPVYPGVRQGTLIISDDAGDSPQNVPVTGNAVYPALSPSSSHLDFGSQALGGSGAVQTLTLTSSGAAPLTIGNIALTGANAGDFVLSSTDNCIAAPIGPGGSCTVSVGFKPGIGGHPATGLRSATLTITDNAADSPQSVSLNGNALYPVLSASPSYLNFGSQALGGTSALRNLTLTNPGTAPLTIGHIAVTGANAGDFVLGSTNNCIATPIGPGGRCTVSVRFKPTTSGQRSAALAITDNAADSPQHLVLSGNALYPMASLSPSSLDFGDQMVRTTSAAQNLNVTSTGPVALTVASATLSGINPADFRVTSVCIPGLVGPNTKCAISVRFHPTSPGHRSAILRIRNNAVDSPQSVTLTGNGLPSRVTILPLTIHLPSAHVVGGGILRISVHTVARGLVTMTLQVATTRTVATRSGTHVTRTVVRYKRQVHGIADKHGQFTKGIRIDYEPVRPERLVVVVTVHMAQGIATGRVSTTIVPLHHR
jgi:hypothetical protein